MPPDSAPPSQPRQQDRGPARRSGWREAGLRAGLLTATLISATAVLAILAFLIYFVCRSADGSRWARLADWRWAPFEGHFGILPMLLGSLSLAAVALGLAYPAAIGICCLAHGLAPRRLARGLLALIHFMASIPTVIYGFVSVILLVPLLRQWLDGGSGFSLLAAGLTLAVLILPTILLLVHVRFEQIDPAMRLGCAALGFRPAGELLWVILPLSGRGLTAAAVLGFGRAIGDTMISLMVAGNAPQVPGSLLDSIRTLTAHIALVVAVDSQGPMYQSLSACGLILFVVMAGVTVAIRRLRPRPRRLSSHA